MPDDGAQYRHPALELLELERKLRQSKSLREALFVLANETFAVLRFDQAVVWQLGPGGRVAVGAISGLADIGRDSPYLHWLLRALDFFQRTESRAVTALAYNDLPEDLAEAGNEWVHDQLLHCRLFDPQGEQVGGILFSRGEPFDEHERAVAEWLGSVAGFVLWAWQRDRRILRRLFRPGARWYTAVPFLIAAGAMMLVPVRLTAIAPAEITPLRPIPITSPVEGVVKQIVVQPNQAVKSEQVLVELDDTSVRNRLAVARKTFDTARADYQRAVNKSFSDEASKAEMLVLESRARERAAEGSYLSEMLSRLRVTAPQGGIAIFSDAEDWRGRPVQPGERIMTVADPSLVGVTIYLPPEDAVQLDIGGEVTVYLNIDPLTPVKARIVQTSYEAIVMPDNTLAYLVKAELEAGQSLPRIGNRGTAKVYGEPVTVAYYLFRKPILFLRKAIGL